jgi:hypothetical protein
MKDYVGVIYLVSLFGLTAVVAAVYSVAQEPLAPLARISRQALRRGAKLLAVLGALALAVHFLSNI